MLTSTILGLGQVGSRFDEGPRKAVWSHAGAYLEKASMVELKAGADLSEGNREKFKARCPQVKVFKDGVAMVADVKPTIVSVCTPPDGRAALVGSILKAHTPKVLICEKPMEVTPECRMAIVNMCARNDVTLLVNYNRRYAQVYRKVKDLLVSGEIGPIRAITVQASNRLWSVGTHGVNILLYFAGENPSAWATLPLPSLQERGEPASDLLCRFPSGAAGRVVTVGTSDKLIFEIDIIAETGRIQISGNGAAAHLRRFSASSEFIGYQVLGEPELFHTTDETESTFTTLIDEACQIAAGSATPSSTGQDTLDSESLIDAMTALCSNPAKTETT